MNNVKLENGKQLIITVKNAREIVIRYNSLSKINETKHNNKIIKCEIDDFTMEVGNSIMTEMFTTKQVPFKINRILKNQKNNTYTIYSTVLTKTTRFLLPILRINKETKDTFKYGKYFVNSYLGTKEEGYMESLYVVYRYCGNMEYAELENKLQLHEYFDRRIDLDYYHTMYIFNIPDKYKEIVKLFKQGKYSKFPENYKKQVLNFNLDTIILGTVHMYKTIVYGVLYKTETQKKRIEKKIDDKISADLEYFSIPEEQEELYSDDLIINNTNI